MQPIAFELLLALRTEPASAAEILASLAARPETHEPPVASFYRALNRAVEAGWLRTLPAEDGNRPGRPGHRYELTAGGARALRAEAARLHALSRIALEDDPA